jgi:putative oxidoreductase
MPPLFVVGRLVFVLYFIFDGLQRLMNVAGSADFFSRKLTLPAGLVPLTSQLENLVGLSMPQILALLAGAIELAAGLLIAFSVGTRFMAGLLIVFTAVKVFYSYDFWGQVDGQRDITVVLAAAHISLIGGLLILMGIGTVRPAELDRGAGV